MLSFLLFRCNPRGKNKSLRQANHQVFRHNCMSLFQRAAQNRSYPSSSVASVMSQEKKKSIRNMIPWPLYQMGRHTFCQEGKKVHILSVLRGSYWHSRQTEFGPILDPIAQVSRQRALFVFYHSSCYKQFRKLGWVGGEETEGREKKWMKSGKVW